MENYPITNSNLNRYRDSPLITDEGFKGILIISGLPQVEDHLFAVEVLTEFLARKGEEL